MGYELQFLFLPIEPTGRIDNDILNSLRREVAFAFRNADFGDIAEVNGRYENRNASPFGDFIETRSIDNTVIKLVITYKFENVVPLGNLPVLIANELAHISIFSAAHNVQFIFNLEYI